MCANFYFDKTKMTAWKSLPREEFMRLFPSVTEQQILNTAQIGRARLEMLDKRIQNKNINTSEHNTEIFSNSY